MVRYMLVVRMVIKSFLTSRLWILSGSYPIPVVDRGSW